MEPAVDAMTSWQNSYTRIIIIFVLVTLVQCIIVGIAFNSSWIQDLQHNFPKYRCNPVVMPFVGIVGQDPSANFNFCVQNIFNSKAAEVFAPIYGILGTFQEVLMTIVNSAMSLRGMFANFFSGVEKFITSIRNKIQYLLNNVRMSFIRIFNLMGKVYGSMFAVLFMGQSAMIAAFNLADNDLIKFLFEFCFAPDTPIQMADGSYKPICDVSIGDKLMAIPGSFGPQRGSQTVPVVESVFRFSGQHTPMVQLHGVTLSSQHYVRGIDGTMIPASAHPSAVACGSIPELVCLNVSGHRFLVGTDGLIVADYDEHSSASVVAATQQVAGKALNGVASNSDLADEYTLGVGEHTEVELIDGSWKRIDEVRLGDVLRHSGVVLGIVQESSSSVVVSPEGIVYGPSQYVYDSETHRWIRAIHKYPVSDNESHIVYNVVTQRTSAIHMRGAGGESYIRDYREVPLPEMEAAYEKEFLTAQ